MLDEAKLNNLYNDIKGMEWKPSVLFSPMVVRELYSTVVNLKKQLADVDHPELLRDKALLDLHIAKAYLNRKRNQVEFIAHIANALMDIKSILEWLHRTKKFK